MARIGGSVSRCWLRLSLSLLLGCAVWAVAGRARASESVVVHATGGAPEPLVGRLCAELASAGYAVSLQLFAPPPACERGKSAHVALAPDPVHREALVATVCFDGTEVEVVAATADPARFAIGAAEALNGLRAAAARKTQERPRSPALASRSPPDGGSLPGARPRHSVSVGQSLVVNPGGVSPLWGVSFEVELGVSPRAAVVLGGFFPLARAEMSTRAAVLRTGVTFLRVGPALRYSLARFALVGSVVVGPGYTWVTATAEAPYVGRTDGALGMLGSAGLALAYPDRGPVFAAATSRASLLLPSPRVELPNEAAKDLGPLLLEASLSFGLRF
jgi:hypothetical protein